MKEIDLILPSLQQIADAIVNTFPNYLEVVIHDVFEPENSIKYIAGNVTNREIGGPATDLLLKTLHEEKDNVKDKFSYKTFSKDGKPLKSTTSFIRNSKGEVVAAFCINLDTTPFLNATQALQMLTSINNSGNNNRETFSSTISETIEVLFDQAVNKIGKQPLFMTKEERIKLVQELNNLGMFQIKDGINYCSKRMGVSIYTIYNYLKECKAIHNLEQIKN